MKQTRLLFTVILLLLQVHTLSARENPFAPVERYGGEPVTRPLPAPDFHQEIVPVVKPVKHQAKVLQEINTTPQLKQPDKAVKSPRKKTTKKKKPILFTQKKLSVKKTKKISVGKPVPKKHRTKKRHRHRRSNFQLIYGNDNLKIYAKGNKIKILTDDRVIDHFKLKRPDRLVLDFGDDFVFYDTFHKSVHSPYIKMLKIGTHTRFYRLTFVLSKNYRYRIKTRSDGYLISVW